MVGMAKNESSHMGTASLVGLEDPDQIDSSNFRLHGTRHPCARTFFCSCGGGGDGTTDGGTCGLRWAIRSSTFSRRRRKSSGSQKWRHL